MCNTLNTKLESIQSKRQYWRNDSTSNQFTICDGSSQHTTCISGWRHNASQCKIGYSGVLCGTCDPTIETYTVLSGSKYFSTLNLTHDNGTNVHIYSHSTTADNSAGVSNNSNNSFNNQIRTFVKYWKKRDRSR